MARRCWKDLFDVRHLTQEGSANHDAGMLSFRNSSVHVVQTLDLLTFTSIIN